MTCPVDGATLTMSERQGIEIDYCPTCRGVWLDRGELDKIIERANPGAPSPAAQPAPQPAPQTPPPAAPWGAPAYPAQGYGQPGYNQGYGKPYYGKRKKSFLEELFD
ncbi:zf-TFIIB domain-containing protein [Sandaracinobacteroides saxicola]|uniref:Zf-TFIIB domain-containing protein n=2 Tax=Sandaracinobacteroides saxicola TaxID=2759707 RepID=A0A7G5IMI0_9SPHN|nr:zf-TFIIB domain-containing protein [Sandaracinobacteroides saxicola]